MIWDQAYDSSDGADYRGSRKVTLGLLSGSVLPLWSALEKTVVACRADMTKAEEALKVLFLEAHFVWALVGIVVVVGWVWSLLQCTRNTSENNRHEGRMGSCFVSQRDVCFPWCDHSFAVVVRILFWFPVFIPPSTTTIQRAVTCYAGLNLRYRKQKYHVKNATVGTGSIRNCTMLSAKTPLRQVNTVVHPTNLCMSSAKTRRGPSQISNAARLYDKYLTGTVPLRARPRALKHTKKRTKRSPKLTRTHPTVQPHPPPR